MASFVTAYDAKCSAFKITRLIYVHCVSKEDFGVHLRGFSCATLVCREIHWSYLESMSQRRVCLAPKFIEDRSIEDLLSGLASPALIRINSSCDIAFVNPEDRSQESSGAIIWDFELLRRNSASAAVKASEIIESKDIDAFCHPVELEGARCNCGNFASNMQCLVSFLPTETAIETPDMEGLSLCDDEEKIEEAKEFSGEDEGREEQEQEQLEQEEEEESEELYAENFMVKGSFHEERYQQALLKCDEAKRKKQNISLRVEFEPDNIEDKNAIKFEVNADNEWQIIGYCDVKKIPKLRTAMKENEIKTLTLLFVKREWISWQNKFSFYACISIVKKGQWNKDSTTNNYNSNLD